MVVPPSGNCPRIRLIADARRTTFLRLIERQHIRLSIALVIGTKLLRNRQLESEKAQPSTSSLLPLYSLTNRSVQITRAEGQYRETL